jgi:hypothetical protein
MGEIQWRSYGDACNAAAERLLSWKSGSACHTAHRPTNSHRGIRPRPRCPRFRLLLPVTRGLWRHIGRIMPCANSRLSPMQVAIKDIFSYRKDQRISSLATACCRGAGPCHGRIRRSTNAPRRNPGASGSNLRRSAIPVHSPGGRTDNSPAFQRRKTVPSFFRVP